jgi:tetratricopeptide (TPR) repeat protein
MGLIAKAVDKIEQKEELPVVPETSPAPQEGKRPGKRKLLFLLAPLVLLVVGLVLGYFLFLKPAPEEPPQTARRSISARKQAVQQSANPAAQKQESGNVPAEATDRPGTDKEAAGQVSDSQTPTRKATGASRPAQKPPTDQAKPGKQKDGDQQAQAHSEPTSVPPEPETKPASRASKPETETENLKKPIVVPEEPKEPVIASETNEPDQTTQQIVTRFEEELKTLGPPFVQPEDTQEALELPEEAVVPDLVTPQDEQEEWQPESGAEVQASPEEQASGPEIAAGRPYQSAGSKNQSRLEVSDRSESRAERYYRKGLSYQQRGDLSSAIGSYRLAVSYNPDHLQANMNLATAYLQAGRFKQAEQILVYLYASRPKDPKVLYNFGVLLYQTKEYASAENKLKKLLEIDPFHLEANLLLASVYEDQGELDKAIAACTKAQQIDSSHPRVLYRLGRVWDLAGQPAQAATYYRQFLDCRSEKDPALELAVRDRLKYLGTRKEEP